MPRVDCISANQQSELVHVCSIGQIHNHRFEMAGARCSQGLFSSLS
jgi:hypothetical protein